MVLRVLYDAAQPTRDMRAGLTHPKRAGRPDLSVVFGPVTIRIEAKRLALGEGLPRAYVRKGMRRFIDRKYESTPRQPGFMLGWVVRDETPSIIGSINKVVVAQKDLTEADELKSPTDPLPVLCRCESKHADGLRLVHCLIDLNRAAQ
jgi:hypothetical protein